MPPTARELYEFLGCPSSLVLQVAIFSALEEQIHPHLHPNWYMRACSLFESSQKPHYETDVSRWLSPVEDVNAFAKLYNEQLNAYHQTMGNANVVPGTQPSPNFHPSLVHSQYNPATGLSHGAQSTNRPRQPSTASATSRATRTASSSLPSSHLIPTHPMTGSLQHGSLNYPQITQLARPAAAPANQPPAIPNRNRYSRHPIHTNNPPSRPLPPETLTNVPQAQQLPSMNMAGNGQALLHSLGPIQNDFMRQNMITTSQAPVQPSQQGPSSIRTPTILAPALPFKSVLVHDVRLLPDINALPPLLTNPDPVQDALHQVHLRQPVAVQNEGETRTYQFIDSFVLEPYVFHSDNIYFEVPFSISDNILKNRPQTVHGPEDSLQLPTPIVCNDSVVLNFRCIKVSGDELVDIQNVDLPTWAACQTSYPDHLFVSLNSRHLEFRRKRNHKRDLPVDITGMVSDGNVVKVSFHPGKDDQGKTFAFAIEAITFQGHNAVAAMSSKITAEESLHVITTTMKSVVADHDDVAVVNESMSIDVTDPYLSTLWATPVRGLRCKHKECFDLQTFLQTRPCNMKGSPTSVYDWKCPLCSRDARPGSLIVDGFMQEVRETLIKQGREDARAIIVKKDGSWTIKEEKLEGTGLLRKRQESTATPEAATSGAKEPTANLDFMTFSNTTGQMIDTTVPMSTSRAVEIIELDDD